MIMYNFFNYMMLLAHQLLYLTKFFRIKFVSIKGLNIRYEKRENPREQK